MWQFFFVSVICGFCYLIKIWITLKYSVANFYLQLWEFWFMSWGVIWGFAGCAGSSFVFITYMSLILLIIFNFLYWYFWFWHLWVVAVYWRIFGNNKHIHTYIHISISIYTLNLFTIIRGWYLNIICYHYLQMWMSYMCVRRAIPCALMSVWIMCFKNIFGGLRQTILIWGIISAIEKLCNFKILQAENWIIYG